MRRVIEPILAGNLPSDEVLDDDVRFVKDLGLVARGTAGLEIANPIYREVVPRALAAVTEEFLPVAREPYIGEDGSLVDRPADDQRESCRFSAAEDQGDERRQVPAPAER